MPLTYTFQLDSDGTPVVRLYDEQSIWSQPRETTPLTRPQLAWAWAMAFRSLRPGDTKNLRFLWRTRLDHVGWEYAQTTTNLLEKVAERRVEECCGCGFPAFSSDLIPMQGEYTWCPECVASSSIRCFTCNCLASKWDSPITNEGRQHCRDCITNFTRCVDCRVYTENPVTTENGSTCPTCATTLYWECSQCNTWHPRDAVHGQGCNCESKYLDLAFPISGNGELFPNERHAITLPSGEISEVGLQLIRELVNATNNGPWRAVDQIEPTWQTKDGNFTKRLSRYMFQNYAYKAAPELITKIGNLAKMHTPKNRSHIISLTRDLNMAPEAYGHKESCWWTQYSTSRCAMKQEGGMAMRFHREDDDTVVGRAWIMGLTHDFFPTVELPASVYAVFNTYGETSAPETARIVAQLTGYTYKKITLTLHPLYINNNVGYLIAPPEVCDRVDAIGKDIILRPREARHG